ncbi:hypothetical protein PIB30_078945 [Stylosanthes scabra]|uniref:Uncharacterized protein n=1 Tax=Stylosanthes scabra TaxID=79078 RepID=A0ABU6VS73_9FABA|nr:hypothetical protein [Stylosanthes scabra]
MAKTEAEMRVTSTTTVCGGGLRLQRGAFLVVCASTTGGSMPSSMPLPPPPLPLAPLQSGPSSVTNQPQTDGDRPSPDDPDYV